MDNLTEEEQIIAVEKVLEEMQKAEEYLKRWNATWYEQLIDAHCLSLHNKISMEDITKLKSKYGARYDLKNAIYSDKSMGIPLAKEILELDNPITGETDLKVECEFRKINWYGLNSHRASRDFDFYNNGDITFSKDMTNSKKSEQISYTTKYNVLSNDFIINIDISKENRGNFRLHDNFTVALKGNIITERFNDIEIIQDLNAGTKLIRIVKKYDKRNKKSNTSTEFEAVLNLDDSLERGAVVINTYRRNGKVNGTYRFDVSRKKGVRAKFYSRKGLKFDLISNSMLLDKANTLLLPSSSSVKSGDIIVSDFADSTQKAIVKNPENEIINLDNSDFNMQTFKTIEAKIMEMIKCIKGEIPLSGLTERIENYLKLKEIRDISMECDKSKKLRLE